LLIEKFVVDVKGEKVLFFWMDEISWRKSSKKMAMNVQEEYISSSLGKAVFPFFTRPEKMQYPEICPQQKIT
jgi:hypothetical protein